MELAGERAVEGDRVNAKAELGLRLTLILPCLALFTLAVALEGPANATVLLGQAILSVVFLVAGIVKLRQRTGFSEALEDLGVGRSVARQLGIVVPTAELGVGIALLVPMTVIAGAGAALVLLIAFSAAVAIALVQGRGGECGCFGQLGSTTIGWRTLARNGVLAALALVVGLAGAAGSQTPLKSAPMAVLLVSVVGVLLALDIRAARLQRSKPRAASPGTIGRPEVIDPSPAPVVTRRRAIGGAALSGFIGAMLPWLDRVAYALPPKVIIICQTSCSCCQRSSTGRCELLCCGACPGFAGGGVVETPSGRAQASFFGTRLDGKAIDPTVLGALSWHDPGWGANGLALQSTRITSYRRRSGGARELRGVASSNGAGSYDFVLAVTDGGRPAARADTIDLRVRRLTADGAGAGTGDYAAAGRLIEGDVTVHVQAAVKQRR